MTGPTTSTPTWAQVELDALACLGGLRSVLDAVLRGEFDPTDDLLAALEHGLADIRARFALADRLRSAHRDAA
jgi:hypothetical protein